MRMITSLAMHASAYATMMATKEQEEIDAAAVELEETPGAYDSALKLIDFLLTSFAAAGSDRTKLNASLAAAKAKREVLAAAVAANPVPVDPPVEPPVEPPVDPSARRG